MPLKVFAYWFWYTNGVGDISGVHKTSKDFQVDAVAPIEDVPATTMKIYNVKGIEQDDLQHGINIVNGKKVYVK